MLYVVNNGSASHLDTKTEDSQSSDMSDADLNALSDLLESESAFYKGMGMQFFNEILV